MNGTAKEPFTIHAHQRPPPPPPLRPSRASTYHTRFCPAARTLEAEARDIEREEQADSADAAARSAERVHEVGVGEHLLRHVGEVDRVGHDARGPCDVCMCVCVGVCVCVCVGRGGGDGGVW